jgi:hypothetical protein
MMILKRNKQGALELSVGTIVIIVIAMSMLILGLVLVRTIFTGATDSVDELNLKVQGEVVKLFSDDERNIVVKLGADNTAKIKQGTDSFGIVIGARTPDGGPTNRERLKYRLTLDEGGDCVRKLGLRGTEDLFGTRLVSNNNFDEFDGSHAFALVLLSVSDTTLLCNQKVFVDVTDTNTNSLVGGSFFKIDIVKSGFF